MATTPPPSFLTGLALLAAWACGEGPLRRGWRRRRRRWRRRTRSRRSEAYSPLQLVGVRGRHKKRAGREGEAATRGPQAQAAPSRRAPEGEADREEGRGRKRAPRAALPVAGFPARLFWAPSLRSLWSGSKGAFRKADRRPGRRRRHSRAPFLCPMVMTLLNGGSWQE